MMTKLAALLLLLLVIGTSSSCSPEVTERAEVGVAPEIDFARDVRPLIAKRCARCHYPTASSPTGVREGGLDMSTLASIRQGGFHTGNAVIVPGNPERSAVVRKLRGTFEGGARMPKDGPYLSEEQIRLVELWIEQGAKGEPDE